ncbi:MAG: hypothetical protein U0U70_11230 [Chitinophagaceae bacterium]
MTPATFGRPWALLFIALAAAFTLRAQTQEEFDKKLTDIYTVNSTDKKKALALAKELYNAAEKKKELQTLTNYYMLKNLFENITPDAALAKTCADKADRLSRELVGKDPGKTDYGNDSMNIWYNQLYPGLYQTTDPDNARKALDFLSKYTSFQSMPNFTGVAYAYERNGDFTNAKKYYEYSLTLAGDEKNNYVSYLYYILFLSRYGDYQKAEEYIRHIEYLSQHASSDVFKMSYRNEALAARTLYYFYIGDYESYVKSSELQNAELAKMYTTYKMPCNGQEYIRLTNAAVASEYLKDYNAAERYWKSRDSAYSAWIKCQKEQYPNLKLYDFSMYPIFLLKRGKDKLLPKSLDFYRTQAETYYSSFREYADMSTLYFKGTQMAYLKSPTYRDIFLPILERIRKTRDFRESTRPFTDFAYFRMRDRDLQEAANSYKELFSLNSGWVNDIIFTFGEKAFVTYYNAKLKEGYENFHSFVKLAKEKQSALFPELAAQAYDNLLFTKSIENQREKKLFIKSNDPAVIQLSTKNGWIRNSSRSGNTSGLRTSQCRLRFSQTAGRRSENPGRDEVTAIEKQSFIVKAKDYKKLLKINPPHWKEVQEKLKEGEAAVEMIRFQWRDQVYYGDTAWYAAYIITRNSSSPDVVYLPDAAKDLDDKYYKLYKNNIRYKIDDKESYNHYWRPIGEKLKGIRVYLRRYLSPGSISSS